MNSSDKSPLVIIGLLSSIPALYLGAYLLSQRELCQQYGWANKLPQTVQAGYARMYANEPLDRYPDDHITPERRQFLEQSFLDRIQRCSP